MSSNPADQEQPESCAPEIKGRGMLIVISSPSGGGKGTLIRRVLKIVPDLGYSVSFTTRAPRAGEVHGRHYFFVKPEEFREMEREGAFLEWAVVHGNLYGTGCAQVEQELSEGRDIILEIDVQGADNVRGQVPDAVMIFILPPSFEILRQRLSARGSENPEDLALRLSNSRQEVEAYSRFAYVVINDEADRAAAQLASIIQAERARRERQQEAAEQVLATFAQSAKNIS